MSKNESNMNGNGFTDFLTFVSPVFVVAVFFLCLFRFLFRCCSCDNNNNSDSENQLAAGAPGNTPENDHNRAVMIRSPRFQPTDYYYGHGVPPF